MGPKSVHLGNGQLLIALRRLLPVPASMPLQIVNRCCSGFPEVVVFKTALPNNNKKNKNNKVSSDTVTVPSSKMMQY